jgi:hypothetical protein
MQGSQLFQLIKSLNKHDMRELRKVVRSPYFNQREDVIAFYDYIERVFDDRIPDFSKEKAFKSLFPNKPYNDVTMRHLMSYLFKIIEEYLIVENALRVKKNSHLHLIKSFRERNADKLFEKASSEFEFFIDNELDKNAHGHYLKYLILNEKHEFRSKKKRITEVDFQEISNQLDYFYISERLRIASVLEIHKAILKGNYDQPLLDSARSNAEKQLSFSPSVMAYYYTYQMLNNPNDLDNFYSLRNFIVEKGHIFSDNERRDLYTFAQNYCIKRLNKGENEFGVEALRLFKVQIDMKSLLEDGHIPPYGYKNILMLAIKAEDYDWAENFLNEFKQYLPEKDRENIYNYNLALFYFRKGKQHYGEAMSLLQTVNLTDVLYNLDARRLLAIIYFEHNDFQVLQSHIESSKIYLHRHKDIGYGHDSYVNFFRFLEKLQKINLKDAKAKEILRGEITATQLLAERDWLINKLN